MAATERSRMRRLLVRWGRVEPWCVRWVDQMERIEAEQKARAERRAPDEPESLSEAFARAAAEQNIEWLREECERERAFGRSIDGLLLELDPSDRLMLTLRYQKDMQWEKVARIMHYSVDRTKHREMELLNFLLTRVRFVPAGERIPVEESELYPGRREEHDGDCGKSAEAQAAGGGVF